MNPRKYPRSLSEAFPFGPKYGCSIEHFKNHTKIAEYIGAICVGIMFAVLLVLGWSQ